MSRRDKNKREKQRDKSTEPKATHDAGPEEISTANLAEAIAEENAGMQSEPVDVADLGIQEHQAGAETEHSRVRALVEAAVYITDEPLQPAQMATALGKPLELVQKVLAEIVAEYAQPHHGVAVRELAGGYQMATKAEHHEELRQFVKKLQPQFKLSMAALETLSVIAYKQPVTAPEILEIRGVQGAGVLKTLLDRKLVMVAGRKQVLGKPALYKTTKEFLVQFGLKDLSELPTLKEFEELSRMALGDESEVDGPASSEEALEAAQEAASETAPVEATSEADTEADAEAVANAEKSSEPMASTAGAGD